jgi:hypothetical protein
MPAPPGGGKTVPDEIDLLRMFRDEMPGPSTDAWARARAAIAVARSEENPAARRPRRRADRWRFPMAAAGTLAAAVAGLVAALLTGSPAVRQPGQAETTAFVTRVEHAVAAASQQQNVVAYQRAMLPAGSRVRLGIGDMAAGPGVGSGLAAAVMVTRSYHGTSTTSGFTLAGQQVFATEISTAAGGKTTEVAVVYRNATWWRAAPPAAASAPAPAPFACGPGVTIGPGGWPAFIGYELRCGEFVQAGGAGTAKPGRQRVDGIDAVKLTGRGGTVLWVDPANYLPVQVVVAGLKPTQIDFRWLSPTAANLAQLSVRVPAGFRRVPPP